MSQQLADNRTKMTEDQVSDSLRTSRTCSGAFLRAPRKPKRLPQCPGRGCSFVKSLNA